MLIEVSSYPKSGNTWMRHILANRFNLDVQHGIPDYHQKKGKTKQAVEWIAYRGEKIGFYKSHIVDCKSMHPDRILHIYRHPLDIFLSSLNYFYIRGQKARFIEGIPKPVEELYETGELNRYFENFVRNAGEEYYNSLLGEKSNIFRYFLSALENPKVISIRYEDLVDCPTKCVSQALSKLLCVGEINVEESVFIKADEKTKYSGRAFYWRSRKQNYTHYLTDEQINRFNKKYADAMDRLGYRQIPSVQVEYIRDA